MPHDSPEKPPSRKDSLMGELESIKNLLDKESGPTIPTLDDSIADSADSPIAQLKLDTIFDDPANTEPPTLSATTTADESSKPQKPGRQQQPNFSIELLIQEIVDEHISHIEAELRERLSQCEPDIIRQLANKKVIP